MRRPTGGAPASGLSSVMPLLVELGLVEERHVRGPGRSQAAWFLTRAGLEILAEVGANETRAN